MLDLASSRDGREDDEHDGHRDDHDHRERCPERPVVRLVELLCDQLAGVGRRVPAQDDRDQVLAGQRDEDEQRARTDAPDLE
jgi:hypothetical protein